MIARFFIDRPIFAAVLSLVVTLAGALAAPVLPVSQYPQVTPPTVQVDCNYPGASAGVVSQTIASPVEQQVNGVEEMLYMTSQCTSDGSYTLTVTFRPGTDLNMSQVRVLNRVALAMPQLPDVVRATGVTTRKRSPELLMTLSMNSPDGTYDQTYLSNYALLRVKEELARIPGVSDVTIFGQRDYAMRVWVNPERLAALSLTPADVVAALRGQNLSIVAGRVGQADGDGATPFEFTVSGLGRLTHEEEFAEVVVKVGAAGQVVKVKDVARVELGAKVQDVNSRFDLKPTTGLGIFLMSNANAVETSREVLERMERLGREFPPGVKWEVGYDTAPFIKDSIKEVVYSLRDAVILVALVVLVFLQSWRAAVIPLAAVPVAIVGTFSAMYVAGFSVNNLTLFGLVLAVGIVVDDAIVVVEAVQHHIENGMAPREATIRATQQVAGPVIAVGLVLSAVFVPCVFISGIVGEFYRQFAVTIAVSTLLSVFVSLTLSPALCALLMKPNSDATGREPLPRVAFPLAGAGLAYVFLTEQLRHALPHLPPAMQAWVEPLTGWLLPLAAGLAGAAVGYALRVVLNRVLGVLFGGFNRGFDAATGGYVRVVGLMLRGAPVVLVGYGGLLYLTYHALATAPSGFIPDQDKGFLLVNVQLPDASSLGRTAVEMKKLEDIARETPGVKHTVSVSGQSILLGANAPNFGTLYVLLDEFPNRRAHDLGADAIASRLQSEFNARLPAARVNVFGAPAVDGLGTAGGFKLVIEDPGATDPAELERVGKAVADAAGDGSELRDTFSGFRADTPWLYLEIDRVSAQVIGVPVSEIVSALQVYFGSLYVNDFNRFGRTWQVNVQARADYRRRVDDLKRIRVRNPRMPEGVEHMVPLGGVLKVRDDVTGPVMVYRYNLYPAAPVSATPAPGVSSGEAIAALERAAADKLPPTMRTEWTELAFLQLQTKDTASKAFLLSVVLVFLVLAAQYESWALPLAVILVVPMCLLSAAVGVRAAGLEINIFTQVGFVVLVGLACKNAILIVEFAKQRHDDGATRRDAAVEACRLRLRPIVMTSVAFIIGVVPLVLAEGAGVEMRRALGTAVFAGMIGVTAFGIFLTPVFYVSVQWVTDRLAARYAPADRAAGAP